eukprot:m.36256 g.36256  ORF g.36256 m.36256 type:complete len:159 (-) comp44569_c0_seq2:48-524(-)
MSDQQLQSGCVAVVSRHECRRPSILVANVDICAKAEEHCNQPLVLPPDCPHKRGHPILIRMVRVCASSEQALAVRNTSSPRRSAQFVCHVASSSCASSSCRLSILGFARSLCARLVFSLHVYLRNSLLPAVLPLGSRSWVCLSTAQHAEAFGRAEFLR